MFLLDSLNDYHGAFDKYTRLLRTAGELPFGELVESVGFENPLKGGVLTDVTSKVIRLV